MATIHFIGGEKGGVGKSLVSRLLAQYLIDRQLPFLGFDSDRSHGALLRFYAAYASPVVIDSYESLDKVVEAATDDPRRRIIVDLAAQTHQPLVKWMEDSGMLELARVPEGAALRDAWCHMGAMLAAFTLFAARLLLRLDHFQPLAPDVTSLLLDVGGFLALAVGGWFGGRLVYGHGVGRE